MLKAERQRRILQLLQTEGRVVTSELPTRLKVSLDTVRRDLDELARARKLQRIHGGALPSSTVADTYEGRQQQSQAGKVAVARVAASLLEPGQVIILDGGTTALQMVEFIPVDYTGTIVTHSPVVAAALGRHTQVEVVLIGGSLEKRAMVAIGADVIQAYANIRADICFLGVWSLHAEAGISCRYYEEARVRTVMLGQANTLVGLCTRDKLGTVASFTVGPASALTHIATEPDAPDHLLRPFRQQGIKIVHI